VGERKKERKKERKTLLAYVIDLSGERVGGGVGNLMCDVK